MLGKAVFTDWHVAVAPHPIHGWMLLTLIAAFAIAAVAAIAALITLLVLLAKK